MWGTKVHRRSFKSARALARRVNCCGMCRSRSSLRLGNTLKGDRRGDEGRGRRTLGYWGLRKLLRLCFANGLQYNAERRCGEVVIVIIMMCCVVCLVVGPVAIEMWKSPPLPYVCILSLPCLVYSGPRTEYGMCTEYPVCIDNYRHPPQQQMQVRPGSIR